MDGDSGLLGPGQYEPKYDGSKSKSPSYSLVSIYLDSMEGAKMPIMGSKWVPASTKSREKYRKRSQATTSGKTRGMTIRRMQCPDLANISMRVQSSSMVRSRSQAMALVPAWLTLVRSIFLALAPMRTRIHFLESVE